jgi:hypothetical protein
VSRPGARDLLESHQPKATLVSERGLYLCQLH